MEIKNFDKDLELESQRNLFKECFPENDGTLVEESEHYLWKFHSFPAQPTSYEYGAYMENDLVGYYAAIPYEYKINNATIKVGMVCDVMTGVKARGKGVFTKMGIYSTAEMKNQGLEFTIGYPIRPEVIPGHIKAGWEKLFPLPLYMNFLSSKSLLKDKSIKFLYPLVDLCLLAYNGIIRQFQKSKKYNVELFSSSELDSISGFNEFMQKWISEQEIGLNKNLDFLKWRLGAPGKEYKILIARSSDEIVGYAVFSEIIKE